MNLREWALPLYTILMQLAVGSLIVLWILRAVISRRYNRDDVEDMMKNPVAVILITIATAMVGSFFHLSRPYLSFLAVLNLKSSWLSREIFFTVLLFGCVVALWLLQAFFDGFWKQKSFFGWAAIVSGLLAACCMMRLYMLPVQASWNTSFTLTSFLSSLGLLGVSACLTILIVDMGYAAIRCPEKVSLRPRVIRQSLPAFSMVAVMIFLSILLQYNVLFHWLRQGDTTAQASLQLYLGIYRPLLYLRLASILFAVAWLVIVTVQVCRSRLSLEKLSFHLYMICMLTLIGEILGRFLFYATHVRLGF